jgi:alpha-amylase/alpha-mannosidase (GH57 family)
MATRAFCIHGHFYQPPREDPLTGIIPRESGAEPFKNWNERIHAECYRPNAELCNFEQISFNVGPTLANWIEMHDPSTWRHIVAQDQANLRRYGVGNAMAQAYNHTIHVSVSNTPFWPPGKPKTSLWTSANHIPSPLPTSERWRFSFTNAI